MKKHKLVLHMDADSFFASCEQSRNPKYKSKPVVVGGVDRGIAVAISLEAKARGIYRGMTIREMKLACPDVIALPVDMRLYGLYSDAMFSVFEENVDTIQRYSIDECFGVIHVDLFEEGEVIARRIKDEVQKKLDITVSIGVSTTKVLAKISSKQNKPNGVYVLDFRTSTSKKLFSEMSVGKVWGIGGQTAIKLNQMGIQTVADLVALPSGYALKHFDKHLREIYQELCGVSVMGLSSVRDQQKSIQKTRTFRPNTNDVNILVSHLSHNIERAFQKVRKMNMAPRDIHLMLKTTEFRYKRTSLSFEGGVVNQSKVLATVRDFVESNREEGVMYRSTGVTLSSLYPVDKQYDLFGTHEENSRLLSMYSVIDGLALKYGKSMIRAGTSMRESIPKYSAIVAKKLRYENDLYRLGLPFLGEVV